MSFVETFAGTLEYAPKVLDDNYEGPASKRRPVTLPPLEKDKDPKDFMDVSVPFTTLQKVSLKSIRAPKFSVEYNIPLSDTVFSIKERLLTDPSGPLNDPENKFTPSSMKLLIKSKVIPDTRQIAELPSTSFIVMFVNNDEDKEDLRIPLSAQIYWGEEAQLLEHVSHTSKVDDSKLNKSQATTVLPGINDKFWKEVEQVAKRYVNNPQDVIQKMQKNFESATIETDLD